MRLNSVHVDPAKWVASILLVYGWYTGEISNLFALMILFILIDVKIEWRK